MREMAEEMRTTELLLGGDDDTMGEDKGNYNADVKDEEVINGGGAEHWK